MSCSSCGAALVWAYHATTAERMPFDAAPHELGEWLVEHGRAVYSPAAAPGQLALVDDPDSRPRYRSHWDTCASASKHRQSPALSFELETLDVDE